MLKRQLKVKNKRVHNNKIHGIQIRTIAQFKDRYIVILVEIISPMNCFGLPLIC